MKKLRIQSYQGGLHFEWSVLNWYWSAVHQSRRKLQKYKHPRLAENMSLLNNSSAEKLWLGSTSLNKLPRVTGNNALGQGSLGWHQVAEWAWRESRPRTGLASSWSKPSSLLLSLKSVAPAGNGSLDLVTVVYGACGLLPSWPKTTGNGDRERAWSCQMWNQRDLPELSLSGCTV